MFAPSIASTLRKLATKISTASTTSISRERSNCSKNKSRSECQAYSPIIPIGIVRLLSYSHYSTVAAPPRENRMVHTTVVGNYPRIGDSFEEQSLRRAIARFDKGEIEQGDLREAEREVVKGVLREQQDAGIEVVTDGQVTWYDSQSHIARKLKNVEIGGLVRYFDTNTYYRQPVIRGAVEWKEPILVDEWKFAQANSKAPVKAVLTGPVTLASLALDKHYGNRRGLATDLATALADDVGGVGEDRIKEAPRARRCRCTKYEEGGPRGGSQEGP